VEYLLQNTPEVRSLEADLNLEILAEALDIQKRILTGVVRLEKTVRNSDAVVDEILTSNSISVERVAVNRYVDEVVSVRHEGNTMIIPVMEEVVIVTKQLVLKEEIRITNHRQQSRHHEAIQLRAEEVQVTRIDPS
jgi:uncharacterized protein (TIGR02271 family)